MPKGRKEGLHLDRAAPSPVSLRGIRAGHAAAFPRDPRAEGTPSPDLPGAPVTRRSGHLLRAWRVRLRTHASYSSGHHRLPSEVWTILWLFW